MIAWEKCTCSGSPTLRTLDRACPIHGDETERARRHAQYREPFVGWDAKSPVEIDGVSYRANAPCVCGGIAFWHGADGVGCDDCPCSKFVLVE